MLAAPELLGVEEITVDGVTLRLLVKTGPGAQYRVQRALREAIKLGLDEEGVAVLPPPPREASSDGRAGRARSCWGSARAHPRVGE